MTLAPHETADVAARGKKSPDRTPKPCPCGCGVLVDPGKKGRKYVNRDHKRAYEQRARSPKAPPGMGRKRPMRAEIGQARLRKLWRLAGRLGVKDWREALDQVVEEALR